MQYAKLEFDCICKLNSPLFCLIKKAFFQNNIIYIVGTLEQSVPICLLNRKI